jgi:hypothetical protein
MSLERVNMEKEESNVVSTTPKKGRPKKSDIVSKKKGGRELRGRPAGDKAILDEYRARMLASPKSAKVLEKVFEIALNDEHAGQMAAMKLVMDRIVPASGFDISKGGNGSGIPQISINITGLGSPVVQAEEVDNGYVDDVEYRMSDTE